MNESPSNSSETHFLTRLLFLTAAFAGGIGAVALFCASAGRQENLADAFNRAIPMAAVSLVMFGLFRATAPRQ